MAPMSKQVATIAASLLLAAGVGGAVGAAVALETRDESPAATPASTAQPVAQTTSPIAAVYERVKDGVVEVSTSGATGGATGSGFVIDEEGHIVTNQHVVSGAESVSVRFADGSEETAEIVGTDPSTDIAVLDVDRPPSLLTSAQLRGGRVAPGRKPGHRDRQPVRPGRHAHRGCDQRPRP